MTHKPFWTSSAAIVTLALAGCGGSSTGLSRSAIDTKANAICTKATAEIKALGGLPSDFETNPTSAASYLDEAGPITDRGIDDLAALRPDSAAAGEWNAFMAANQAARKAIDSARAKAHSQDPTGLQDFEAATGQLTRVVDATARTVGATACAD